MTEHEYILASRIAMTRIAQSALGDVAMFSVDIQKAMLHIEIAIEKMEAMVDDRTVTEPDLGPFVI